jgi:para-nitrobenzyl esterase
MKKIFLPFALFFILIGLIQNQASAQCTGVHFRDYMFADSLQSDLVYGSDTTYNKVLKQLTLDLYFPKSDPNPHGRPLIIWVHSGNFIQGDKTGADVVPLCQSFTKMGYVTASINYRLGMENVPVPGPDTLAGMRALIRAMHDCRAAVRYFRKSVANGNPFGIDSSMIFIGGLSSGAIAATHLAYLDQMSKFPLWCDTTKAGMSGGIEGKGGSPGYSSKVKAVISICGAIGDTSWIQTGATPILCFHGDKDSTVPYNRGRIDFLNQYKLQTVYGGHSILQRVTNLGIPNCFDRYVGQNHLPELGTDSVSSAFQDTTLNMSRNFLIHFVCGDPLSCTYKLPLAIIEHKQSIQTLHCYPNPASSLVTVELPETTPGSAEVRVYNAMGMEVRNYSGLHATMLSIERGNLASGLYLLEVIQNQKRYSARIVFN